MDLSSCNNKYALHDWHPSLPQARPNKPFLRTFALFNEFPLEIASAIWKCSLKHHRLITISLTDSEPRTLGHMPYSTSNRLGNFISGKPYCISVQSDHRLSPLFRTCQNARQAALEFYRLQIPFNFQDPDKLFLNPDYDFLHVKVRGSPGTFADFLYDAKAYDPIGVGILNLGIGEIEPEYLKLPLIPSSIDPQALSAFTSTLQALNTIFFRHVAHWETRQLVESVDTELVRYNLSYPLNSSTEIFDLLPADPRPINADLDVISVGWDPRAPFCLWRKLERGFNISRSQPPDFQFLITAHSEEEFLIKSRTDAARFLKAEREGWEKLWDKEGLFGMFGYEKPEIPQEPFSVFGFWMFPMDAFGDLPPEEFDGVRWDMKVVANLGKYRPQLGVFRLPSE